MGLVLSWLSCKNGGDCLRKARNSGEPKIGVVDGERGGLVVLLEVLLVVMIAFGKSMRLLVLLR